VRTAEQIRQATIRIDFDEVKLMDLLFFEHTYDVQEPPAADGHVASHIGFSLGAGTQRMWDANSVNGVGITNIGTTYWQPKLFEARRLPGVTEEMVERIFGIDVASHQGNPNWAAVASSGVKFGITKATGGTGYKNPTFGHNWAGMQDNGIIRGAYHYAFETTVTPFPGQGPEAEADVFSDVVLAHGLLPGDLLALDIEDGNGNLGNWCLRWLIQVERRTGVKPFVYTGAWFSVPHGLGTVPELGSYPLWLAAYQAVQPSPPPPWNEVAMWQYSASGRIAGISGDVDTNWFNGSTDDLKALGLHGPIGGDGSGYAQPGEVGSGLLEMMAQDGTVPAGPSTFLPLGRNPAFIEEGIGMNGTTYRWHLPTGKSWRLRADS
jgi:lysozyme